MSATIFSLIAVVLAFSALLAWAYWPSNKAMFEAHGRIPLEDGASAEEEGAAK